VVDLNPLHYVNKFNHMFGDSIASGLEFLGISDPAVDPDGVREIAKKWRHLATGLDDAAGAAGRALSDVEWEGKAAKAFHKRAKATRTNATKMADSLRDGAKALDDFADKAHELLSEIGVMLAEIVEFEIAGLALSILTAGASEVASNLMAGERALKVVALIARIEEEGTALGTAVRAVMEVIRGVERALKALKEIRGVAAVAKMAKEGVKFSAFETLLQDPGAFKDPGKLAGILTEGALMGIGFGVLGKALGKGLKALKPAELSKLSKLFKLNCASFERLKLNPGFNKLPASVRNMVKKFVRDPIDVATGDMALPRVDVQLPGVLPLVLERTHLSSYRFGGWFGPSWASTLDQRVQADDDGFVYAAADGARLCFPRPDVETNEPVGPETAGSRLTLSWDDEIDGAVRITDPDSGLIHVFHSPVATVDDEAVDLPLQHIQDRNGNRITVVYAEGDIPAAVVHSGGYRIALDRHPSLSRITGLRLIDPTAPDTPGTTLVAFGYDEIGHLTEETNSSGLAMRYSYDTEGRITSWTDRNGTTYWYAYDDQGRVIATGGTGNALASTLTYDDTTRATTVTDSLGHTRVYEHNGALRLIRETDPLGNVTTQEWDEALQLVAATDALGRTTRSTYDEHGRATCVVRPDGTELIAEYNELGLPILVTDPDGSQWLQEYDRSGNPVAITDPAGRATRFTYDGNGSLTSVTDALGHSTIVRNDRAGLPLEVTDALGAVSAYGRDAFGRPVVLTDPLGAQTRMEWTVEGKPARRTASDGSEETWLYDGEGNCVCHVDPNGGVSHFEFTYFDVMSARTGQDGVRYEFTYDTELRLVQVLNPLGLTWNYEFDAAGRLVMESDFDGRVQRYHHDAAGLLTEHVTPLGLVIRFERDALGQVLRKDAAGRITDFTYDLAGRLTHAAGPDAVLDILRDATGQVLSETVNGRELAYTYDALGNRVGRTTPSGAVSTWTYDAVGNRIELTTSGRTLTFTRDAAGREVGRQVGEQVRLTHTFDELGRLCTQSVIGPDGRDVQKRAYSYRPDGHVTGVEDQLSGRRRFTLDQIGRVTGVQAEGWQESYAYDPAGNQTQASWPDRHPGQETRGAREYAGTRITRAGTMRYEHDAAGRMTLSRQTRLSRKPDTWRFEWDAENCLSSVLTPDGTEWRYWYDPLGRRIAKLRMAAPGSEIVVDQFDFTWDGTTLCEETSRTADLPHLVTLTWDHDDLHPVSQTERITTAEAPQQEIDGRFFAIVTDLVGAPAELVDEQGRVAWRARATLWGATAWSADSRAYTPLRFPGQYYDKETGHHYNYFRHYVPDTARYTTPDPLGLEPADNSYAYVENPLFWIDPLGLSACPRTARAAQLQDFYEQAQKYGKGGYKELANGRFRFYGEVTPARNPGEMIGRRLVREWDPATGVKRIWHETLDTTGKVRIVRPDVKVTGGRKVHYQFDKNGKFTGTF
jgi:RHS repeat-associated protein